MKFKWNRALRGLLIPAAILTGGMVALASQDSSSSTSTPQANSPSTQLIWATDHLEASPKPLDLTADFSFAFTNASDSEAVIDSVRTSCSCTAAKLPSEPWHIAPHTNGQIAVSVNLKGKAGEFEKTITVFLGGREVAPKILTVTVKMPDRNKMRADNTQIALADRQAVFKGECAKCHAEPAKTLSGMALYHEVCGICHEAHPRASVVPDLRLLPHPTDVAFWKTNIANGKPGTLMPAFAASQGGPLTEAQIDELAKAIDNAYPYSRFGGHPPQPMVIPAANSGAPTIGGKPLVDPSAPSKN